MKNAIIEVESKQSIDEEGIKVVTPGNFYEEDGIFYAVYEETEISGMEGTMTTIKIEGNKVFLKRKGSLNSEMIFEEGKNSYVLYETPYGTLDMKITTDTIKGEIRENGGALDLEYILEFPGQAPIKTNLKISISLQGTGMVAQSIE